LEVLDKLEKECSECGSLFICEEDSGTCWCASLPKLSKEQITIMTVCAKNVF